MQRVRTRLVNFRVTDEEFEKLKTACERNGARCMSDFARNVMLSGPDLGSEELHDQLLSLHRRVSSLETSISRLIAALSGPTADLAASER